MKELKESFPMRYSEQNGAHMKKLQPKQSRVKFNTKFLLEGITPSSRVSLGPKSSLWKSSWTVEVSHGAKFGLWVPKNV
jgi:hypothetical protein